MGVPDPRDGTSLYWKLVARNKRCATLDLKSDEGRDARCCGWSTTPTCSSRTSGRARSSGSASGPTCCSSATPSWSSCGSPASARTGRTRAGPGSPPSPRRCPGFAAHQRRARRRPAAAADRAHRRGHRARRRLRHDGGAVVGRRAGGRREPARVAVPVHGPAAGGLRGHRLPAAPPRLGHPLLGAAGHVAVRATAAGWPCRPRPSRWPPA